MYYRDEATGNYVPASIKALDGMPIGSIIQFAGEDIPTGWLVCNGDAVEIDDYLDLYNVIGTTYGGGNTNFRLPDFRGRVPVGLDPTDQLETFDTLGNNGGERTHTLTSDENAKINLKLGASNQSGQWQNRAFYEGMVPVYHDAGNQYWDADLDNKVQPHNNLQPYLVVNFIIKALNSTPTMASVVNATNNSTEDAYSCDFANKKFANKGDSLQVFSGNSSAGTACQINTTWEELGKFNYLIVILKKSSTNAYSPVIIPYTTLSTGNNLNDSKINSNIWQTGYIDGSIITLHLIPRTNISSNSITFDTYGSGITVSRILITY